MSRSFTRVLFSIALFLTSFELVFAQQLDGDEACMETRALMDGLPILPHMTQFWDEHGVIEIPPLDASASLQDTFAATEFTPVADSGEQAVLGANQSNHWLRFCLQNSSNVAQNLVLALAPPVMAEIDFYPQKQGLPAFQTGNTKKMNTRDINSPEFHFNIALAPGEKQEFYLRVFAATNAYLSARLWDRNGYEQEKDRTEAAFGIFVGVLIGLILYNLLLFIRVRQSTSVLYIAWSVSVFLLLSSIDGRVLQYLTPNNPELGRAVTIIFYPVSVLLSALFGREFIKLKNYPRFYQIGNYLLLSALLILVIAYQFGPATYFKVCAAFALMVVVYFGLYTPIYIWLKHKSLSAKYVLITQVPLILCVVDLTLFALGVTSEFYVPYTPKTGLILAMIIVSYYVGFTIYRDKDAAQRAALEQLEVSNTLKSNYNQELEAQIAQKTADIRSMNESLEEQATQLKELDHAKSKFFANISHEFRTPLTLIQGPLSALIKRDDIPEKDTLEGVLRNSKSLQQLIDQLLVLSELDENSIRFKASKTGVGAAVKGYVAQFASMAQQNGIELVTQVEEENTDAYIDPEKLQIIINNLVSNALKFTDDGGEVRVIVSASHAHAGCDTEFATDRYISIKVLDTGCGIAQEELPFVFDRYFQSRSSEAQKSGVGTGIGLALVKELVDLHAGDVSVHSATLGEQRGTSFHVRLPLGRAHLTDAEVDEDALFEQASPLDENFSNLLAEDLASTTVHEVQPTKMATILVVDDNADMRAFIETTLQPYFNVVTAEDGEIGEQVLRQEMPDLIVTDLMMPKRDGLEFVESIKQDATLANIPVIMLTARASQHDRITGLMAAVDDYLVKPFNANELLARIRNLLTKRVQLDRFYAAQQPNLLQDASASSDENAYVGRLREIVESRMVEPNFGVEELAKAMNASSATLRRRIAEVTHFTPAAFIRHCRLERARQLSELGNMRSIAEIAQAVGFSQPSYFARLYQKTFNSSVTVRGSASG